MTRVTTGKPVPLRLIRSSFGSGMSSMVGNSNHHQLASQATHSRHRWVLSPFLKMMCWTGFEFKKNLVRSSCKLYNLGQIILFSRYRTLVLRSTRKSDSVSRSDPLYTSGFVASRVLHSTWAWIHIQVQVCIRALFCQFLSLSGKFETRDCVFPIN